MQKSCADCITNLVQTDPQMLDSVREKGALGVSGVLSMKYTVDVNTFSISPCMAYHLTAFYFAPSASLEAAAGL